jgi:hypothetical protein
LNPIQAPEQSSKIQRESPKTLFSKYLSNLNNIADYNRSNLLGELRRIMGDADYRNMLSSNALDNLEPQQFDHVEKLSEYFDQTSRDIMVVSPIDISMAYLLKQKQPKFRSTRRIFIAEAVAPIVDIINNLGLANMTLRNDTPLTYIQGNFKADVNNCDIVYFNARFAMTQLYLFLIHALSAMNRNTAGGNKHILIQCIKNLGDDLTLLIVAHRVTTLRDCTQVVELSNGRVKRIGSYQEIIQTIEQK